MKKTFTAAFLALAVSFGFVAESLAQTNPNQLINLRKGAMNLQGKYFGPLLAMSQGRLPYDAAIVRRNAEYLSVLSQLPWDDFQPSTTGNANSRAKEDVFKDAAKFKAGSDALLVEVGKLVTAARSGDQAAVGAAVQGVGKSCNSCHDGFATFEFRFKM